MDRVSEPEASADVTGLLHAWTGGDAAARAELMGIVYRELHQRAVAGSRVTVHAAQEGCET
jgi:hypothetical protein